MLLCSERYSINTISKSFKRQFRKSWENSIQTSSKMSFYRQCKTTFKKEAFSDLITNSKDRYNLTRLRISAHHLEIEKGRHRNIPQEDRSCARCELCLGLNIIENENHLLNDCDLHASNRKITTQKLLANESQFMNHSSFPQFTFLSITVTMIKSLLFPRITKQMITIPHFHCRQKRMCIFIKS